MNEVVKIQERLKEIATELSAFSDAEDGLTEEQTAALTALEKEADELTVQLDELRKQAERDALKAKADSIRATVKGTRTTSPGVPGPRFGRQRLAIEDDPTRGFKTLAHFANRVKDAGEAVRSDEMLMQVAAGTGMDQAVNSEGGALVPPQYSKQIWDRVLMDSNSLLQYCDQIPVDPQAESITVPRINETSRADGSRYGGIQGYWKDELTQMTEKRPAFGELKLAPHELYVFAFISDKLLRNAPQAASAILERGAAQEIAFKIGDAIFEGDGVGKPVGIKSAPCTLSISKETNQAAATIMPANIRKMAARLHPNWRAGSVWFVNIDCLPALEGMEFPVGVGGVPAYLPPGGLSDSPYSRLYGRDVIPLEYCSTLGTVGDIVLANLNAYAAAVKGLANATYSIHLKFDYNQTAYRVIFEMDGQPWLNSAITPFKGSNTLSPFVTLATRS